MSTVILGLGRYVEEITEIVSQFSEVVVVEREEEKLRSFLEKEKSIENLSVVPGNATDIELWKEKVGLDRVESVISFLNEDSTLDIARVLRKAFGFKGSFIYVAKERPESGEFRELGIELISVPDVLGAILKNLLKGQGVVKYPVGIGLRKGEVAEVLITKSSPAVFMRLSELRLRNVRIALIYREGSLILPRTDLRVQPGDRLLVVGEPSQIELFLNMVTKGESNFPLKWGPKGVVCGVSGEEFEYVRGKVKVREWLEEECEPLKSIEEVGLYVLRDRGGFLSRSMVDSVFTELRVPSLLLRGSHPYENILVSANTDALGFLLPNAVDFARLFGSKVFILMVTSIEKMLTKEEKELLESLKDFVERTQTVSKIEVKLIRKEGNPVRETLKLLKGNFNLLAVGYTPGRKSSFFSPYTPHLLAKKARVSTLMIPEVSLER